ncbi:Hypothetical protein D9617_11g009240 [Elsinoe fawcettii]|nr:Hypothetical protein D9617_11g009240 [Elsinoe fawcettii]
MRVSLLFTALLGTAIAADSKPSKAECTKSKSVYYLRSKFKNPKSFCKFLADNEDWTWASTMKEVPCKCANAYKQFATSTKAKIPPAPANATEQVKAGTLLRGFIPDPSGFCTYWQQGNVTHTKSPIPKVNPAKITELCQKVTQRDLVTLDPADAAAPNLFLNPYFAGTGRFGMGDGWNVSHWDVSGAAVIVPQTTNQSAPSYLYMYTYGKDLSNGTVSQTVLNLTAGSSYHIWVDESWGCMRPDKVMKNGATYKIRGAITFNATKAEHNVGFRVVRPKDTYGSTSWELTQAWLTGPW